LPQRDRNRGGAQPPWSAGWRSTPAGVPWAWTVTVAPHRPPSSARSRSSSSTPSNAGASLPLTRRQGTRQTGPLRGRGGTRGWPGPLRTLPVLAFDRRQDPSPSWASSSSTIFVAAGRIVFSKMSRSGHRCCASSSHVSLGWGAGRARLSVDTTSPAGEAMANVMANFAEFELRLFGQRSRKALAIKRAEGVRLPDRVEGVAGRVAAAGERRPGRLRSAISSTARNCCRSACTCS
jgi:hypothetical protein